MSLSTPSLYLNTDSLQNGDLNPFFASLLTTANAGPWARVSGAEGPLRVYPCALPTDGTSTPVRVDFGTNTFHIIAKVEPTDEDLSLEIDFTKTTDGDYFYYEANPASLSVPTDIWNGNPSRTIICDFEERNTGGTVLRIWRANLTLTRGNGDGGSPAIPAYVSYSAQSPTAPQKTQALTNLGGGAAGRAVFAMETQEEVQAYAGGSSFDPASPGPIGGTTPDAGTFTVVNLPSSPSGDANTALSQDGTILSVEAGAPIGASSTSGVAKILTQSELVAFLQTSSPTFTTTTTSGLVVLTTVSRGGTVLGTSATDGLSQEWKDGSGAVVGYVTKDGDATFQTINTTTGNTTDEQRVGSLVVGPTDAASINGDGSMSAASGTFTVSTAGLLTTAHAKIQGSAGVAGAIHLSHGTTPTGQASTATVYGVSGGIGVIDGTGTAYTLTLGGNVAFTTIGRTLANAATAKAANAALYEEFTEYLFNAADMASATPTGTGYTSLDAVRNEATTYTTTAGVGNAHASFGSFGLRGLPFSGFPISAVPFSKRMEFSGTTTFISTYLGDANSTSRVYIGGRTSAGTGNVTARAIGWKKAGGSANVFLSVHNGTSETTVDTGFAPTTDTAFSWRITSDGAGNVVMYINGTQVATTAAGPSTTGTGGTPPFQSIEGVSGNTTRQAIVCTAYRIRVYAN